MEVLVANAFPVQLLARFIYAFIIVTFAAGTVFGKLHKFHHFVNEFLMFHNFFFHIFLQ